RSARRCPTCPPDRAEPARVDACALHLRVAGAGGGLRPWLRAALRGPPHDPTQAGVAPIHESHGASVPDRDRVHTCASTAAAEEEAARAAGAAGPAVGAEAEWAAVAAGGGPGAREAEARGAGRGRGGGLGHRGW